ncbi:MAG: phosphohistidine phosphatase SixA [Moraxellaceae bacterium]|nr:phosphohistidine phosphatase SixA [Moraxellaceae bacterium]
MRLVLVRHGEAEAHAASDAERALTRRGRQQALETAEWLSLRHTGHVQLLVSPYRRAQETAAVLIEHLPGVQLLTVPHITPDDDVRAALKAIAEKASAELVVVVSHMPLLARLAEWLESGAFSHGKPFGLAEGREFVLEDFLPGLAQECERHLPLA